MQQSNAERSKLPGTVWNLNPDQSGCLVQSLESATQVLFVIVGTC